MHQYQPVLARTSTMHGSAVGPVAYDCVKVIIVRDGSAFLVGEFGQRSVKVGDVILLGANVLCGSEPEGHITVTTIYLDSDYVLDQVRWQYAGLLCDHLDAQGFADTIYTEPAQFLRLGEDRAGMLMPWLDELMSLSIEKQFARDYFRIQALWFSISHVIAPFIRCLLCGFHLPNAHISGPRSLGIADLRPYVLRFGAQLSCCEKTLPDVGRWRIWPQKYTCHRRG